MFRKKKILKTLGLACLLSLSMILLTYCSTQSEKAEPRKKELIRIGAILPLSGNAAVAGEYSRKGLELAVKEINEKGGIKGRKIELIVEDSQGKPNIGVIIIKKLNTGINKPKLIYCQLSSVCLSVKPITESIPQILFAVSGASDLLNNSSYTFRNYVSPERVALSAMEIIKESLKASELGIFYSNNDFGLSINNSITEKLENLGIKLKFSESFDENQVDYRDIIKKQLERNPENVYIVGIGRSLGILIKQLRESGYKGNIIGGLETPFPDVLNIAGKAADGIYYIDFSFDNKSEKLNNKKFIDAYFEAHKQLPQTPSAVAYDAIYIYKHVVEQLDDVNVENIKQGLLNVKDYEDGSFGKISIINFNIIYPLELKKIRIGE